MCSSKNSESRTIRNAIVLKTMAKLFSTDVLLVSFCPITPSPPPKSSSITNKPTFTFPV